MVPVLSPLLRFERVPKFTDRPSIFSTSIWHLCPKLVVPGGAISEEMEPLSVANERHRACVYERTYEKLPFYITFEYVLLNRRETAKI